MSALHNKYSYCLNNPLKYTDPSGWAWSTISALNHDQMMVSRNNMHLAIMQLQAEMNRPDVCKFIGQTGRNSLDIEATEGSNFTVAEIVSYLKHMKHILQALGAIPKDGVDKDGDNEVDEDEEDGSPTKYVDKFGNTIIITDDGRDETRVILESLVSFTKKLLFLIEKGLINDPRVSDYLNKTAVLLKDYKNRATHDYPLGDDYNDGFKSGYSEAYNENESVINSLKNFVVNYEGGVGYASGYDAGVRNGYEDRMDGYMNMFNPIIKNNAPLITY